MRYQRTAVTGNDAVGARGWAVRARVALAAALRERGEHGPADDLDREAKAAAGRIGLPALIE